jgi:uncharacterized protein (UPF0333 family)
MNILLLSLVLVGVIFLICYAAWYYTQKANSKVPDHVTETKNKNRIMETIYKEASKKKNGLVSGIVGSHSLKINVLNKLDISPYVLGNCIKKLIKEDLIIETDESVALTSFGVQHYEIFIRKILSKKKAKK